MVRTAHILAEGVAAVDMTKAEVRSPRGLMRFAAPMSFGALHVAPLLPGSVHGGQSLASISATCAINAAFAAVNGSTGLFEPREAFSLRQNYADQPLFLQ